MRRWNHNFPAKEMALQGTPQMEAPIDAAAASALNVDSANMMSYCNLRTYNWREDGR